MPETTSKDQAGSLVAYIFDIVSVDTLVITTSAGEAAARAVADNLEVVSVQATRDELDCLTEIPAETQVDVRTVAPRGPAALIYAEDAQGGAVEAGEDGGLPEPISGGRRTGLAAALNAWKTASGGPSGDEEQGAAEALAAAVAAALA